MKKIIKYLIKKNFRFFSHIIAIIRILLHPTSTWYTAWFIQIEDGDIAGKKTYQFTHQGIMFDGTERLDMIPYRHTTVKGNCLVEVFSSDTRPYYYRGNILLTRNMRFSGKACTLLEAKWNNSHTDKWIQEAISKEHTVYQGKKFKTKNIDRDIISYSDILHDTSK